MLLLYQIYYNYFYSTFIMQWESERKQENLIAVLHIVDHISQVERKKGGEKETKTDISTEKKTTFFDKWKKI